MSGLLFKNARLIDPALEMDKVGDLLVENDKIAGVGENLTVSGDVRVIDAAGRILAPGLVDLHVHFRDPGQTHKETLETGCSAAAAGGFTAVVPMANTTPAVDNAEMIRACIDKCRDYDCRVYPAGAVTLGLKGEELADLEAEKNAGIGCFSDDGFTVNDNVLFLKALNEAARLDMPVSVHCEAAGLGGDRTMNQGDISRSLSLKGVPAVAEELMILRDIFFAEKTGAHVHVQHVSSARGVEMIADAKRRGLKVTGEASPHHMFLDESAILEHGTNAKMSPPLRTAADSFAIREALKSGVLDVVATDHAPHSSEEKARGMIKAPNGIIGLETSLAMCLNELCHKEGFPVYNLIERMSTAPRRIFKLPSVTLEAGSTADLVLIDTERKWLVDATQFKSKGRNCPFTGRTLKGKAVMTVLGGKITHEDE